MTIFGGSPQSDLAPGLLRYSRDGDPSEYLIHVPVANVRSECHGHAPEGFQQPMAPSAWPCPGRRIFPHQDMATRQRSWYSATLGRVAMALIVPSTAVQTFSAGT